MHAFFRYRSMHLLSLKVEQESERISRKFSITVDGWTNGSEYLQVHSLHILLSSLISMFLSSLMKHLNVLGNNMTSLISFWSSTANLSKLFQPLLLTNCETKNALSVLCEISMIGCYPHRPAVLAWRRAICVAICRLCAPEQQMSSKNIFNSEICKL